MSPARLWAWFKANKEADLRAAAKVVALLLAHSIIHGQQWHALLDAIGVASVALRFKKKA